MSKVSNDNIMAFSGREKSIYETLEKSPLSIAAITKAAKLPRTSVIRTITKLKERGVVASSKTGKRAVWQQVPESSVTRKILEGVNILGISLDHLELPGLTLLKGKNQLTATVLAVISQLPRHSQLNGIQSTKAALLSIEKMGVESVITINEMIKKKALVVRGVVSHDGAASMRSKYGTNWHKSFIGRTAHFVSVANNFLDHDSDLYIIGRQILLVNWKDEVGVKITNEGLFKLINNLYLYMFESGERIDYHLEKTPK